MESRYDQLYRVLSRIVYLAVGVFLAIWFLDAITFVLLLFVTAAIIAIALNPPVTWLEDKGVSRALGTALVCLVVAVVLGLIGWLVVPRLIQQGTVLAENLPRYASDMSNRLARLLRHYPAAQQSVKYNAQNLTQLLPSFKTILWGIGQYSITALSVIVVGIVMLSVIIYMLAHPRPLLRGYFAALPAHLREPAERALARSSQMVVAWMWAQVIIGGFDAIVVGAVLTFLDVPGAVVWAGLAFFSELIPQIGPFIMATPPILVALAIEPVKGLWAILLYAALNEFTGSFLGPLIRGRQMNLHPVSVIFMVLALGSAFGIVGALISTPLTGFIKVFYEEFYLRQREKDERIDERVDNVLHRCSGG
ncbi:MAG TPA: AI-2E family transporter [Chthonomonadaceae bacterium]|nr:AI-2E family transporter [Chthonomonadaceae bacterium]